MFDRYFQLMMQILQDFRSIMMLQPAIFTFLVQDYPEQMQSASFNFTCSIEMPAGFDFL